MLFEVRTKTGNIPKNDVEVKISGPNGWNNNTAITFGYLAGQKRDWILRSSIVPITGKYKASVLGGETSFFIDGNVSLKPIEITSAIRQNNSISAYVESEEPEPSEALSGVVIDITSDSVVGGIANPGSSLLFNNLKLEKLHGYSIFAYKYLKNPFSGSKPLSPFNIAFNARLIPNTEIIDLSYGNKGTLKIPNNDSGFLGSETRLASGNHLLITTSTSSDEYLAKLDKSGNLDVNYGQNGFFNIGNVGPTGHGVLVSKNNQILVRNTQQGAILRFDENGILDQSFGVNGKIDLLEGNLNNLVDLRDFATDQLGSIYATGNDQEAYVKKFDSSGKIQAEFGNLGTARWQLGVITYPFVVRVHPNGGILIGGSYREESSSQETAFVAKLTSKGVIDTSFGNSGFIVPPKSTLSSQVFDIAVQSDGKIIASGQWGEKQKNRPATVTRYLENGKPDLEFGENGTVNIKVHNNNEWAKQSRILPDGKILVTSIGQYYVGITRLTSTGVLDFTFGGTGMLLVGDFALSNLLTADVLASKEVVLFSWGGVTKFLNPESNDFNQKAISKTSIHTSISLLTDISHISDISSISKNFAKLNILSK